MPTPECFTVSPELYPERLCQIFEQDVAAAISRRGECNVALPGGSVAEVLFPLLRERKIEWDRVKFFWSDERAVPLHHEDSNFRVAHELLLKHIQVLQANIFPMTGDPVFLAQDAKDYEDLIRTVLGASGVFDLIVMGVGSDGHVCSLFPDHPLLFESTAWVGAVSDSPKPPAHRLTLTLPILQRAGRVLVGATGIQKAQAVADATRISCQTPLARLIQGSANVAVVLDEDAASKLSHQDLLAAFRQVDFV